MPHPKRGSLLWGGRFALGICVGVLLAVSAYLAADVSEVGFTRDEILQIVPSLLTLLVAFVSLLISFYALSEQRIMRQAGTDPVILVHLDNREDARILSTFEVRNVGAGAARNVSISLISDISEYVPDRIITDFGKLTHPIRTIPQNHSVSYNFGVGHKLLGEPEIPPIKIKVDYENIEGDSRSDLQVIDVKELKGQRADDSLSSRLTKAAEKAAKTLEKLGSGLQPMHVTTESYEDYHSRQDSERAEMYEFHKKAKKDSKGG
jgi:hypothetical protein